MKDMEFNKQEAKCGAIGTNPAAITLAHEVTDQATDDLPGKTFSMEQGHFDWVEVPRFQVADMGLENDLANQTSGAVA